MSRVRICRFAVAVATIVIANAGPAIAQSGSHPRVEISANVGGSTGATFKESESFPSYNETATLTANHAVKTAVAFDVGGAVRIVPRFWVGVQYAMANATPSAAVTAQIPHPLLFNAPRTVSATVRNLAHHEHDAHVDLWYVVPVGALEVQAMAGPTFFSLTQDFVTTMAVNETYPFDTATFSGATTARASGTALGFNAGVDISRQLTSHAAVGALVRYSRADVKFDRQTVKAGGLEAGGGVRVRFSMQKRRRGAKPPVRAK